MARGKEKSVEIDVVEMQRGELTLCILGRSPLIFNCVAAKAQHELLMPRGRMTTADKAANLKHNPPEEFRNSVYRRLHGQPGPTRLQFPAPGLKAAMAAAALDTPSGVAKAQIGRLTWVEGQRVDIYGIPQLLMAVVRSADAGKTPDIRTRAICAEWACRVTISYVMPVITPRIITTLMATAGMIIGLGDWRQQKGSGNHGQFEVVPDNHPDFLRVIKEGGMKAQDAALADPVAYDADTEDLLAWFHAEFDRRKTAPAAAAKPKRGKGSGIAPEARMV